jgi:hypothetical protein
MPSLKTETALEFGRKVRLFLNAEVGLTGLGAVLLRLKNGESAGNVLQKAAATEQAAPPTKAPTPPKAATPAAGRQPQDGTAELRKRLAAQNQNLKRMRDQLAAKEQEIVSLRAAGNGVPVAGIRPENLIWIFGVARTGSTWLSAMMGDLEGQTEWPEPYVGDVFGYAYYIRAWDWMRERKDFVLGNPYKDVWLKSIRNFILDGANARYPEVADGGYLVIKEPNGSTGAPLIVEALPESRVVLLVRDPRDVVSSLLAANRKGSWTAGLGSGDSLADQNPDEFVRQRAHLYMGSIAKAREAHENHEGPKTVVRYEDLRYNALGELKRLYSSVGVPVEEDGLRRVVEKHDWENVPAKLKGADKPRRKAKPGGYLEDLTPEQVRIVEDITGPILKEFYPEQETVRS